MSKSLQLALCDTQGQLFVLSAKHGYDSQTFAKVFMTTEIAADLDKKFHHLQWAGKGYILSRLTEEYSELLPKGEVFDEETLYWMGYLYRYWNFYTGESSKEIYKQAPAKTMQIVYLMYHTMSPELAIERLKESYQARFS